MTNNDLISKLNKATGTLTTNAGIISGYASSLPANDDEATEQHVTDTDTIANAVAALDTAIGAIAWS